MKQQSMKVTLACLLLGLFLAGCVQPVSSSMSENEITSAPESTSISKPENGLNLEEYTVHLPQAYGYPAEGKQMSRVCFLEERYNEYGARMAWPLYYSDMKSVTLLFKDVYAVCGQDEDNVYFVQRNDNAEPLIDGEGWTAYGANVIQYNFATKTKTVLMEDVISALLTGENYETILCTKLLQAGPEQFEVVLYALDRATGVSEEKYVIPVDYFATEYCFMQNYGGLYLFSFANNHILSISEKGDVLVDSKKDWVAYRDTVYDPELWWEGEARPFVLECGGYEVRGKLGYSYGTAVAQKENGEQIELDMNSYGTFAALENGLLYYNAHHRDGKGIVVFDGNEKHVVSDSEANSKLLLYRGSRVFLLEEEYLAEGDKDYDLGARGRATLYELVGTPENPMAVQPVVSFMNYQQANAEHELYDDYYFNYYHHEFGEYVAITYGSMVQAMVLNTRTGEVCFSDTPGLQVEWHR